VKFLKKGTYQYVFLAGTATDVVISLLKIKDPVILTDMDDAVYVASLIAKKHKSKTVILSPGAKSFGLFKNEFDRGEKFNRAVMKIVKE
jgi:UDP-N-acetylmuramoylalanine--D-glutamate ligase